MDERALTWLNSPSAVCMKLFRVGNRTYQLDLVLPVARLPGGVLSKGNSSIITYILII